MLRMFKKVLFAASTLAIVLSACSKQDGKPRPQTGDGKFIVDGIECSTLQEAVDFSANNDYAGITLTGDAAGEGAVISGDNVCLTLDLAGHKYTLYDGAIIQITGKESGFEVNDGELAGGDGAIVCSGEDTGISGNGIFRCGISSVSEINFGYGFTGKFYGNLSLDGYIAYFCCPDADIKIDHLEVKGDNASVQIFDAQPGGIRIGHVSSQSSNPVCGFSEGVAVIGSGVPLHVHSFTKKALSKASCHELSRVQYVCTGCGFSYEDEDLDGGYGGCKPKDLVYVPAVQATNTGYGNVAFWQCPFCGRAYADDNGKQPLEDYLTLPLNYELGNEILGNDNDVQSNDFHDGPAMKRFNFATNICTWVGTCASLAISIYQLISDNTYTQRFIDINASINAIQGQIVELNQKLDKLLQKVDALPAEMAIRDRNFMLDWINVETTFAFNNIEKYLKSSMTTGEKEERIKEEVTYWGEKMFFGTQYGDLVVALVMSYYSDGVNTVPSDFAKLTNLHCLWEHQGYGLRSEFIQKDVSICGRALVLAYLYAGINDYPTIDHRNQALKRLEIAWKNYSSVTAREKFRVRTRGETIRKINIGGGGEGVAFKKNLELCSIYDWIDKRANAKPVVKVRLPRVNGTVSSATCETIIRETCFGLPLTISMVNGMVKEYRSKKGGRAPGDLIKDYLVDSVKFGLDAKVKERYDRAGNVDANKPRLIIDKETPRIFGHDEDDSRPNYGPFQWSAVKMWRSSDSFQIRWALSFDGTHIESELYKENVAKVCLIDTSDDGYIYKWQGEASPFVSPVVIEPKDIPDSTIQILPLYTPIK